MGKLIGEIHNWVKNLSFDFCKVNNLLVILKCSIQHNIKCFFQGWKQNFSVKTFYDYMPFLHDHFACYFNTFLRFFLPNHLFTGFFLWFFTFFLSSLLCHNNYILFKCSLGVWKDKLAFFIPCLRMWTTVFASIIAFTIGSIVSFSPIDVFDHGILPFGVSFGIETPT